MPSLLSTATSAAGHPPIKISHTLHTLNVISSSAIHQKVSQILRLLELELPLPTVTEPSVDTHTTSVSETVSSTTRKSALDGDAKIVALSARGNVANKLISIVEIAKRGVISNREEDVTNSGKTAKPAAEKRIFQYTTVTGVVLGQHARRETNGQKQGSAKKRKHGDDSGADEFEAEEQGVEDEEDDGFEELARNISHVKVRKTPVLTIYLSTQSIPEMKELYDEQVV